MTSASNPNPLITSRQSFLQSWYDRQLQLHNDSEDKIMWGMVVNEVPHPDELLESLVSAGTITFAEAMELQSKRDVVEPPTFEEFEKMMKELADPNFYFGEIGNGLYEYRDDKWYLIMSKQAADNMLNEARELRNEQGN